MNEGEVLEWDDDEDEEDEEEDEEQEEGEGVSREDGVATAEATEVADEDDPVVVMS